MTGVLGRGGGEGRAPGGGSLQLVMGPMFAGKSTELLRRLDRYRRAGQRCLLVGSALDVRYGDAVVATHDAAQSAAAARPPPRPAHAAQPWTPGLEVDAGDPVQEQPAQPVQPVQQQQPQPPPAPPLPQHLRQWGHDDHLAREAERAQRADRLAVDAAWRWEGGGGDARRRVGQYGLKTAKVATLAQLAADGPGAPVFTAQVLALDEGQFYPDLMEFAVAAADAGQTVIVAMLDGDRHRRPAYPGLHVLVAQADSVVKLTAVCGCGADAPFTALRERPAVAAPTGDVLLPGGAELYRPSCRACHPGNPRR